MSELCLDIRNVGKHYGADGQRTVALDQVNLAVAAHEFLTIVGPSGCGKSTLLYLIGGFFPPSDGEILLRGRRIEGPGPDRGVVFQKYSLFPWLTVADNIGYGLREKGIGKSETKRLVEEYLGLVHLEGFAGRYPRELSGGMQQRVAIAQALACKPEILLMDEPFGALDAQTRRILQTEVRKIWQRDRTTVLFVTHDVEEAVLLGTRIVVMAARPGRIKEVLTRPFEIHDDEVEASQAFIALKLHVWKSVKAEVDAARAAGIVS
jgi:NitT/TauT family transport system ATP-binding protein